MRRFGFLLVSLLLLSSLAFAEAGKAKKIVSIGAMALSSSTIQGGNGPSGSTLLTQSEFILAYTHFGYGLVFDYDLHGTSEKDSAYGIKVEGYYSHFYLELGYLISAKRAYTDRSIAEETGTGLLYGVGLRFPVGKAFFHASYKMKTQTLTKQDGVDLSEKIIQKDGYPLFGFGFSF